LIVDSDRVEKILQKIQSGEVPTIAIERIDRIRLISVWGIWFLERWEDEVSQIRFKC
jgi:hypothetical protein